MDSGFYGIMFVSNVARQVKQNKTPVFHKVTDSSELWERSYLRERDSTAAISKQTLSHTRWLLLLCAWLLSSGVLDLHAQNLTPRVALNISACEMKLIEHDYFLSFDNNAIS